VSIINNPFACDGCGKRREKDTNHWFILWEWWHPPENTNCCLAITPWFFDQAAKEGMKHACGVNCLMKLCERFATTGRLDAPKAAPIGIVTH
jgi:hypothetical protein